MALLTDSTKGASHGARDGGSKCVTAGLICVPQNIMILKKSESSRKELSGFFVSLLECSRVVGNKSSNKY